MHVASSERVIAFDCDDTLIFWDENYTQPFDGAVKIVCPHDGEITYHRPHQRHINFLKKQKARGYSVKVWSSAGTKWAEAVVLALNLENYVDQVSSKPEKYVDDLPDAKDVLGIHIYLNEEGYSK